MIVLACILFYTKYIDARTKTFITLDKFSGLCADDDSLETCCEVPASITGNYFADNNGLWNTESGFSYVRQIYSTSLTSITYTNEEWKVLIHTIQDK